MHPVRKAVVEPWTPEWAETYGQAEPVLREALGERVREIHHVGSTSVPAIGYAKPILDILVIVDEIAAVDRLNDAMAARGFVARGENGIPGRRYFVKWNAAGDQHTHHVHIHAGGDAHIPTYVDVKAYLEQHPDEARAYGERKRQLAQEHADNVKRYQDGKADFVEAMVQRALDWARQRS